MYLKRALASAALAVGLAVVPAVAQNPQHQRRGGFISGQMLDRMGVVLDLTDAQKDFAKKLATDTRAQAQPVAKQLRENRKEIAAAVKANNQAQIDSLTARQGTLMAQLSALRSKAMASFYAQLTPEQKAKADKLHEGMQNHMRGMKRQQAGQNRG